MGACDLHRESVGGSVSSDRRADAEGGSLVRTLITIPEFERKPDLLRVVRDAVPAAEVIYEPCPTPQALDRSLDAHRPEILFTREISSDREAAASLKWLQFHFAGMEEVLAGFLRERDVVITNVSGAHAVPIAEYVLGCIVLLSRHFVQHVRDKDRRVYDRSRGVENDLRGKTAGLIGYGMIGRAIAQLLDGVGMRILALKRDPTRRGITGKFQWPGIGDPDGLIPDRLFYPADLDEMLAESDYVICCAPFSSETRGMMGERQLKAMKPSAYLINVSRGGLFDEDALVRALRERWISGAALDAYIHEPLPAESPFWDLGDHVFLSPHVAGTRNNPNYNRRTMDIFVENISRYTSGRPLLNVVDKQRGY